MYDHFYGSISARHFTLRNDKVIRQSARRRKDIAKGMLYKVLGIFVDQLSVRNAEEKNLFRAGVQTGGLGQNVLSGKVQMPL